MTQNKDQKQLHLRATEDKILNLKKYCKETGLSENAAVMHAIELLEIERAKGALPTMTMEIEEFMLYTEKVNRAYKSALEHIQTTEERVEAEYRGKLEGLVALGEANRALKAENERLLAENQSKETRISELIEQIASLDEEISRLNMVISSVDENSKNIDELTNYIKHIEETLIKLANSKDNTSINERIMKS